MAKLTAAKNSSLSVGRAGPQSAAAAPAKTGCGACKAHSEGSAFPVLGLMRSFRGGPQEEGLPKAASIT